ncbi:MAG: hypothetical protein R6W90_16675 [Ignavibacteriaceae bacterium]
MSKGRSSKSGIAVVLMLLVMAALTILAYVGIKKKCEVLAKDKVIAAETLASAKNGRVNLLAQYQMLSSEERITGIAVTELGMKKRTEPAIVLKADKEKIERISKVLKEKYE